MEKTIIPIILGIFLLSLVSISADTLIAGECLPINLSKLESLDNIIYDVVGNSSNLEGLTIELNGTIANICTLINYKPDNFTVIFIDDSTKEIIKEVPSGGGGGRRTKIIEKNITEYIEVDNYVDREVEVIKEIENTEKIKEQKKSIKTLKIFLGILIGVLVIITLILIKKLLNKRVKNHTK